VTSNNKYHLKGVCYYSKYNISLYETKTSQFAVRLVIFSPSRQGRFTKGSFHGGKAVGTSNYLISPSVADVKNASLHSMIILQ